MIKNDIMKKSLSVDKKEIQKLKSIISKFRKTNIMVIGDLILDEFIWGNVSRISPEAPVPVVCAEEETFRLGGACNVASNIVALGGNAYVIGVVGEDKRKDILIKNLKKRGMKTSGVLVDKTRPTTLKTRVVAKQRNQQVVRIDKENVDFIRGEILNKLISKIKKGIHSVDALILEDYGKGVITPDLLKEILEYTKNNGKKIIVDPKRHHFSYYKGVTLITPNQSEVEDATGIKIKDKKTLEKAGKTLLFDLGCEAVLVTLGESGMCLLEIDGEVSYIKSVAQGVFDVSGAGDTVVSCFAQSLISGANLRQAALISNFAAGVVVGKFGTEVVTKEELIESLEKNNKK